MISKNPELLTIFLIVFVDILGFTIILPLLPFYSESMGATPFVVGTIVSCYGICQLISGPILGQLSDRVGRRPVLLLSQIGTFVGFVMLALANKLWIIFAARIIDGITAGNITVAQAYISDVTSPDERTKAMGLIGAAFGLGFILGPAISGILSQAGHSVPLWVPCGLSFLSICGSFFFLKDVMVVSAEPKTVKLSQWQKRREMLATPKIKSYYISYLAFSFSFALFVSGLALYCERNLSWHGKAFTAVQIGYLLAYSGFINLTVQIVFLGRLVQKFGEELLVRIGFLSAAIGLFSLGFTHDILFFMFGISLNSFGNALLRPNLTGLISRNVSPHHQGLALGFAQTLMSVAQIVCPLISGFLIEKEWYFIFTSSISMASVLGLLSTLRIRQPKISLS